MRIAAASMWTVLFKFDFRGKDTVHCTVQSVLLMKGTSKTTAGILEAVLDRVIHTKQGAPTPGDIILKAAGNMLQE